MLPRGLLTLLLVQCVAYALQQHGKYPTIHLRTRSISTQELVERYVVSPCSRTAFPQALCVV